MAANMFLYLKDVKGDSLVEIEGAENPIEIQSFSHSFMQPTNPAVSGQAHTIERATHSNITLSKMTDSSSPFIMDACWTGKVFIDETKILFLRVTGEKEKAQVALEIVMKGVVISSFNISAGAGDVPYETISLAYTEIKYNYKTPALDANQKATGNVPIKHDLKKNVVSTEA